MIKAENLTKRYGAVTAVNAVSFEVAPGEICGFLGPNGAGKTTTMRVLTGFIPPSQGRVEVAGLDVARDPLEVKKRVGYLPETTPLYGDMRVEEYLQFVGRIKGVARGGLTQAVGGVMEAARIADRRRSLIRTLSKGYRQRVGLAQALIGGPEVLILDEPTIGLDPTQIKDIRSLIKSLAGKRTVILSSHILSEVQLICSRVVIIKGGRLLASESIESLAAALGGHLSVSAKAPADQLGEALARLPGVKSVAARGPGAEPGAARFEIVPSDVSLARREIARFVVGRGWELVALTGGAASLEEAYLSLVGRADAHPEPEAPHA
ncbi:MAG: ABC transporter ATP-binding protein [Nitrospinae bacterium]|nr:ABC transporter ATP-binding protein [Nitrospinota bacterium]